MNHALWVAKTGLEAQQTRLAVQSNNLANANTTGFKRARAVFEDLVYQNVRQVGAQSSESTVLPSGLSLGTGVRVVATEKLFTQGNLVQTGNALDVAVDKIEADAGGDIWLRSVITVRVGKISPVEGLAAGATDGEPRESRRLLPAARQTRPHFMSSAESPSRL